MVRLLISMFVAALAAVTVGVIGMMGGFVSTEETEVTRTQPSNSAGRVAEEEAATNTGSTLESPIAQPVSQSRSQVTPVSSDTSQSSVSRNELLPEIPPRPGIREEGIAFYRYRIALPAESGQPGYANRVWVYLPKKAVIRDEASPALFYTPSGGTVFSGTELLDEDESVIMPWVYVGFAVVCYETDGSLKNPNSAKGPEMADACEDYLAANAGLINANNALRYALARFPEIDAKRLYVIGHSSGGKQALHWLANERRLAGGVVFAPPTSISLIESAMIRGLPVSTPNFFQQVNEAMPDSNVDRFDKPVLVLHAMNDKVVKTRDVASFANRAGKTVELLGITDANHFDLPLVGRPHAVRWLTQKAGIKTPERYQEKDPDSYLIDDTSPANAPPPPSRSSGVQENPFL